MASRSKSRAEAAIAELKQDTGKEAIFLELDLSSLASVRKAAEEFARLVAIVNASQNAPHMLSAKNRLYTSCTTTPES